MENRRCMMDRLSSLPEGILHNILSRLPNEEAARTTVLSKTWFQTWSTFPFLVFNESTYYGTDNIIIRKRNSFYNFVDKSLLRFQNQGSNIKKLDLCLNFHDKVPCHRFDNWLELAKECCVEVLHLELLRPTGDLPRGERYHVPSSVLEAKSLVELSLDGYSILLDQGFMNYPIKSSSLKVLCLTRVKIIDNQVLQNLLTCFPFVEYITLDRCQGIDIVSIHGHSKLKGVKVEGYSKMKVEIDAPSLENFHYAYVMGQDHHAETNITFDKCVNLNELFLQGLNIISDRWFLQHHSFTLVKSLELRLCTMPRWIDMSFPQLKVIKLDSCEGLKKAYIDAPKLYLCNYIYRGKCDNLPTISFLNSSSQLEISVDLVVCGPALACWKLREFFQQLQCRNVSATLSICNTLGLVRIDELPNLSVHPPLIKHLKFFYIEGNIRQRTKCSHLVTSLLWSCRPSIISFGSSNKTFNKILCETLKRRKENVCFCISRQIKCWWHELKDVKVTCSLDSLPNLDKGDISLRLE